MIKNRLYNNNSNNNNSLLNKMWSKAKIMIKNLKTQKEELGVKKIQRPNKTNNKLLLNKRIIKKILKLES